MTSWRPIGGLLGSTVASVTGNAMVLILVPYLVLEETGNAAYAGLINSAALVAALIALIFGAALLDRRDRRGLSVGADALSGVAVIAIPLAEVLGVLSAGILIVLVVVGAIFDGPGRAAREAMRPAIATRSGLTLERTNALGEMMDGIGNVLGPAGAGLAVAAFGLFSSFWLAGALFVLAAAVFLITQQSSPPERGDDAQEPYLAATAAGFRLVWRDPVLRSAAVLIALFGVFLFPTMLVLTAVFEADGRPAALGAVLASFAIGSIVGAAVYAVVGERVARRPVMLLGLLGFAVGIAAMALVLEDVGALVVAALATGVVAGPVGPVFSVVIQQRTADNFLGRVIATLGTLEMIAAPLSMALVGVLIEFTSPATAMVVLGIGCAGATVYGALTPGLRHIESTDLSATPDPIS
jgi:MFS family permease